MKLCNVNQHIVPTALYGMFSMPVCIDARKTYRIKLHVKYSAPDDEHKVFETCRRQEELN